MAGRIVLPPMSEAGNRTALPLEFVRGLLDSIDRPLMVAERSGNFLLINNRAKHFLESSGHAISPSLNLFNDFLKVDARKIFDEIEKGEHEVSLQFRRADAKSVVQIRWMPEPDWLVVEIENRAEVTPAADPAGGK